MYTATTPGTAVASAVSTDTMRPRATSLRTNATCSVPGHRDVVDVAAAAGQEPRVLAPCDALADEPGPDRHAPPSEAAARRTALMIPW